MFRVSSEKSYTTDAVVVKIKIFFLVYSVQGSPHVVTEREREDMLITLSRSPQTELLRAQLNEVGPKELCCWLGARPLITIHI